MTKLRDIIRFRYFLASGDNPKKRQKEWNCDFCLQEGGRSTQSSRNCPYINNNDNSNLEVAQTSNSVKRYSFLHNRNKKEEVETTKTNKEDKKIILEVLEYNIYSCPVATVLDNKWLTSLIDLINWSVDMKTPLFDGGLVNHTNYYFECYKTIVGEQRAIESEEIRKQKKESKNKTRNQTNRKPLVGKASRSRRR